MTVPSSLNFIEGNELPTAPAAGRRRLYAKSDGWYDLDSSAEEALLLSQAAADLLYEPLGSVSDAISDHEAALNPHPQYLTQAEGDALYDALGAAAAALASAQSYADGLVVGLWDDRGNYDASGDTFPASGGSGSAGAILKGDVWTVSVAGTLGGVAVELGDTVRALIDTPGQTAGNWAVQQTNIGYIPLNAVSNLSDLADVGTARTNLGLDTAAVEAVGVSGHTLPFLDGFNTWGARQIFPNARLSGAPSYVLTGSIDTTASASVVGVGTLFTTELEVGQYINVGGTYRRVESITDDLNLTVDVAFTDLANDVSVDAYPLLWSAYIQDQTAPAWVMQHNGTLRSRGKGRIELANELITFLGVVNYPDVSYGPGATEDADAGELFASFYKQPLSERICGPHKFFVYANGEYSGPTSITTQALSIDVIPENMTGAGGIPINVSGISGNAQVFGTSVLSSAIGCSFGALMSGTSICSTLTAQRGQIAASGFTGSVTTARALHAGFSGSGGTWTNVYGVYVDAIPFGTNQFAFFSAGDEPSQFGGMIQFAGATSSFPALKRSSAELQARLADDSAYADYAAANVRGVTSLQLNDVPGAANSYVCRQFLKTGIADAVATAIITVTVPNGNHNGVLKMRLISANGSTDASESTRTAECSVIIARTTGVDTAKTDVSIGVAGIATVGSGNTHTLAYATSALTGASGATQTFTVNITIDDNGNVGGNEIMILAELHNKNASGITMAAA